MKPTRAWSVDRVKEHVWKIYIEKVTAYGKKPILDFKWAIIVPRLSSKKERISNLLSRRQVSMSNESVFDNVIDILGYCIIWEMLEDGTYKVAPVITAGEAESSINNSYEYEVDKVLSREGRVVKNWLEEAKDYNEDSTLGNLASFIQSIVNLYINADLDPKKIDLESINMNRRAAMQECIIYLAHQSQFYRAPK